MMRRWLRPSLSARYSTGPATRGTLLNKEAGERPPVRVRFTPNAGRGVFATRDIQSGELILTAKPAVTHPSLNRLGKVCCICLRRLEHSRNDLSTGWKLYCSPACEDQAKGFSEIEGSSCWSNFHDYCSEKGLKFPLLVKRAACMIVGGLVEPDFLDILYPPSPPSGVLDKLIDERKLLTKALADTGVAASSTEFLTDEWYSSVLCRIHLNTFRVETMSTEISDLQAAAISCIAGDDTVGSAVYILPSMFNHNCDPNVNIFWPDSARARLEALRDIGAGEELTITYVDASMPGTARRSLLDEAYGFRCQCTRCLEEEEEENQL